MQKEELMLQKRLIELSRLSYQRGIVTFSDFLNLNEHHLIFLLKLILLDQLMIYLFQL